MEIYKSNASSFRDLMWCVKLLICFTCVIFLCLFKEFVVYHVQKNTILYLLILDNFCNLNNKK